ncbi:MAG: hypothetical protein OFPII_32230 [Osedax symbiont Rs1]|nr:MAG: hypothetical protein OFPII_32230 [Osedax symbiont Rs1]
MQIFDSTPCQLGEGPLWHPLNQELYWFDILAKKMFRKRLNSQKIDQWQFNEHVSAAAWIDQDHLLIASESALIKLNISGVHCDNSQQIICPLEADIPNNRSNDGRADPWGGFWIGTMDKQAKSAAGGIYRYYLGELVALKTQLSIPNSICFTANKQFAYYTDTREQIIWRQQLDLQAGWPIGEAELFIDLRPQNLNPDGAICDRQGNLWVAQWGASRIAQYSAKGQFLQAISIPTAQPTCPAFGATNFTKMFVTSASQGLSDTELTAQPAGQTFCIDLKVPGLAEHPVILGKKI